jgi:hypothetical protein
VDQPGRFVGLTGRGGTIRGAFEAAPSAVAYRVEIARRPDGTDVAAAIEISAPTTEFALHRLPAGVYYVAVATIDEWLLEGLPSPRRAVQVLEARVIPPGGGEPVVEPYDPGDPSRPDRLPRVLPGTWIVAPVGFSCGPSGTQPSEMSTLLGAGRTAVRCFDPGGREVPAFDVVLEAPRALVEREPTLVRRRVESRVRLRLESDLELPSRLVAWSVPGVHIGHVTRQPDGAFEVPITVSTDGPSSFAVTVGVAEADERVALSHFAVEVEGAPVSPPSVLEEPAPDRRRFDTALAAFSHLPLPNVVGLLPTGGRGARFHVAFAAITPPRDGAADSLRTNVGARARLFDQPFEIGFDWTIDGSGDYASSARRGQADIRVFTNLTYPASDDFALTTDVTAWIPTHAAEGSLDDVRLVPSVTLEGTFARPLFFRTRQALVVDTGERALAWSSAYGVDARLPSSPLTLGAEIQVVVGDVDGRGAAAVGLAATAGVKLGPTETIVGVRGGLGPDAQALMGELTGLVAVRVLIPSL